MNEQYAALVAKMKKQALEAAEGLVILQVENVLEAVEIAAKQSATPIDDMAVMALKEPLKKILVDLASQISK